MLGAVAGEIGESNGGDVGKWIAGGVVFLVTCVVCAIVRQQVANPMIRLMCRLFPALTLGLVGQEIGNSLGGRAAGWGAYFLLFFAGWGFWTVVERMLDKGKRNPSESAPAEP